MRRFNIQFPFVVRQGILAAESIAAYLLADGRRSVVLRVSASDDPAPRGLTSVSVRFEGGTHIVVSLFDRSTLTGGSQSQDWVIVGARARYWARGAPGYCRGSEKVQTCLGTEELLQMEYTGGWLGPHVASPEELT